MALLDNGNTEFRDSVTRGWAHHQSGGMTKLLSALTAAQKKPKNADLLKYLYKRLYRWAEENEKEVAQRGTLYGALREEIVWRAKVLGVEESLLQREAEMLDAISEHEAALSDRLKKFNTVWSKIEITDQPTGVPGQYNFTKGNEYSEADRNLALSSLGMPQKEPQFLPEYWLRLGRLVMVGREGKYYGRCFSCAAAVIYSLVMDADFEDVMIEHVGSISYDHHLVLVNRANANGNDDTGLNGARAWGEKCLIIDVWQGNNDDSHEYVKYFRACQYVLSQQLKWFCAFPPEQRNEHSLYGEGLAEFRPDAIREVSLTQRGDPGVESNLERRTQKVDGKWQMQVKVGGVWVEFSDEHVHL